MSHQLPSMVNDSHLNLFTLFNLLSLVHHYGYLMRYYQILMDFRALFRTQILLLLCIKVTLEIDSSSFIRSLFCLRSIFPIIEYKIDVLQTKICNDAFYNNYPVALTSEYRLGVITASTRVYSRYAGDVSSAVTVTISQFTTTNRVPPITQQNNQGQGGNFQTTPFNNNNQGQGGNFQTTPFNNQQGNLVTQLPPNNNQGNNQGGNFQTTTIRSPFRLSTVPATQMVTEARVTPEFDPSEDTFNDAFYDEEEPYAAPRQKTQTTVETTTARDTEPLEFAPELLPAEKIIEGTHINCGKDIEKEKLKTENVTQS